ncbi:MAG: GTP-binding protein [Lachnospiraceae bacterium]|nr:GTP-binding protein [Lachnospiraceae bacterium]
MTKIDIISGFLGAGKTTLIRKLLGEALSGEKCMLIENEFGEIAVDGGFLKDTGVQITEMSQGCICCSLVGDFETSLKEAIAAYNPERILIEPSGVGKLSDVIRAVKTVESEDVVLNSASVVVDAMKVKMYTKNFGEFYNNQIASAGTIILSRTGKMSEERVAAVIDLIRAINAEAAIIATPWEKLSGEKILTSIEQGETLSKSMEEELLKEVTEHHHEDEDDDECCCGHHHHHDEHGHHHDDECCEHHHDDEEHEHHHHHGDEEHEHHHHHDDEEHEHHHDHDEEEHEHHHDHDDEEHEHHHHDDEEHEHHHHDHEGHEHHHHHHHHGHDADEVFVSWGLETAASFTKEEIQEKLNALNDADTYGIILRAKGMVAGSEGADWIYFDFVPEEMEIRTGEPEIIGKICVIGSQMKEDAIAALFSK